MINRRGNWWTGWYQKKYFPLPVPLQYLEDMLEAFNLAPAVSNNVIFTNLVNNIISSLSDLTGSFDNSINENLLSVDTVVAIKERLDNLNDKVIFLSTLEISVEYYITLVEILNILSFLDKYFEEGLVDNLSINITILLLYFFNNSVIEPVVIEDSENIYTLYTYSLSSDVSIDTLPESTASFISGLSDTFLLTVFSRKEETYNAYLLSPETNSISTYSNYNFNGCTKFSNKYLFFNKTGLYEYGGLTDDGDTIRSEMETVAFNFNSSNLKQVPSLYLGVDSTDNFILKVRVDGKAEVLYKLNKYTNNLMTQKVDIGKGLIGRYFQFELITEASEFNLESIEFMPLEIRRKL